MKKYLILIIVLAVLLTAFFWPQGVSEDEVTINNSNVELIEIVNEPAQPEEIIIKDVLLDVPFTSQAPYGDWNNKRYQDGCEEASVLMAMKWVNNNLSLSKDEADIEINDLAVWQQENYGNFVDTSATDTSDRLLGEYFSHENYQVVEIVGVEELIFELLEGNIIIVPTNGQILANPNFTEPGPDRHMLVIKGYDVNTQQFITNDPGTRNGENWKYHQDHLFRSIRDYPTGNHLPITNEVKNIIIISK